MSRASEIAATALQSDPEMVNLLRAARDLTDEDVMVFAKLRLLAGEAGDYLSIPFTALTEREWEAAERLNDMGLLG